MTESDRPLPTPPRSRFGRQLRGEEENAGPLTADRLTQAAAEGRLEDFLQRELPEGEHARNLAMMMLGMSGVVPEGMPQSAPPIPPETATAARVAADATAPPDATGSPVPPGVLAATMQGDVAGLVSLLRAEHERRGGEVSPTGEAPRSMPPLAGGEGLLPSGAAGPAPAGRAGIDQALVDELIRIAAENQVTVDWLLLRAVKLYLEEHRTTGRL
jgi:hypothetical protein